MLPQGSSIVGGKADGPEQDQRYKISEKTLKQDWKVIFYVPNEHRRDRPAQNGADVGKKRLDSGAVSALILHLRIRIFVSCRLELGAYSDKKFGNSVQ